MVTSEGASRRTQEALALDLVFMFSQTLRQTWRADLTLLWSDLWLRFPSMHMLETTRTPQNSRMWRWSCMDESLSAMASVLSTRRSYGTDMSAFGGHRRQLPPAEQGKRLGGSDSTDNTFLLELQPLESWETTLLLYTPPKPMSFTMAAWKTSVNFRMAQIH